MRPPLPATIDASDVTFADGVALLHAQWCDGPAGNAFWLARDEALGRLVSEVIGESDVLPIRRLGGSVGRSLLRGAVKVDQFALAPVHGRWQVFVHLGGTDAWVPFGWAGEDLIWVLAALAECVGTEEHEGRRQRLLLPVPRAVDLPRSSRRTSAGEQHGG